MNTVPFWFLQERAKSSIYLRLPKSPGHRGCACPSLPRRSQLDLGTHPVPCARPVEVAVCAAPLVLAEGCAGGSVPVTAQGPRCPGDSHAPFLRSASLQAFSQAERERALEHLPFLLQHQQLQQHGGGERDPGGVRQRGRCQPLATAHP